MREIGVRELKQTLSEALRAVARGEQIRVTVRGRPVADLVPAAAAGATGDDPVRELVAQGRVVPPSHARPSRAPRLSTGRVSASDAVLAERDAER